MRKCRCVGRHATNRTTRLLKYNPSGSIRMCLKIINDVVNQFRCEFPDESGFDVRNVRARIVDITGPLQRNIVDGIDIFGEYGSSGPDRRQERVGFVVRTAVNDSD